MRTVKFTVEVNTGNASFDGSNLEHELALILREIARDVENGATQWNIKFGISDSNGNNVGKFYTTEG